MTRKGEEREQIQQDSKGSLVKWRKIEVWADSL